MSLISPEVECPHCPLRAPAGGDAAKTLETPTESAYVEGDDALAPVAQLDRVLVFGTSAAKTQVHSAPKTYADPPPSACHNLCHSRAANDPDLAALVLAWPSLPAAVKAGIVAMVKAAAGTQGGKP